MSNLTKQDTLSIFKFHFGFMEYVRFPCEWHFSLSTIGVFQLLVTLSVSHVDSPIQS